MRDGSVDGRRGFIGRAALRAGGRAAGSAGDHRRASHRHLGRARPAHQPHRAGPREGWRASPATSSPSACRTASSSSRRPMGSGRPARRRSRSPGGCRRTRPRRSWRWPRRRILIAGDSIESQRPRYDVDAAAGALRRRQPGGRPHRADLQGAHLRRLDRPAEADPGRRRRPSTVRTGAGVGGYRLDDRRRDGDAGAALPQRPVHLLDHRPEPRRPPRAAAAVRRGGDAGRDRPRTGDLALRGADDDEPHLAPAGGGARQVRRLLPDAPSGTWPRPARPG